MTHGLSNIFMQAMQGHGIRLPENLPLPDLRSSHKCQCLLNTITTWGFAWGTQKDNGRDCIEAHEIFTDLCCIYLWS